MTVSPKIPIKLPIAGLFIPALFLLATTIACVYNVYHSFCSPGPLENTVAVIINRGSDLDDIARILEKAGIVRSAAVFRLGVRMYGMSRKLKAGEFLIQEHASAKDIMQILVNGKTITHSLTIPEGLTSQTVINMINEAPGLIGDPLKPVSENGILMPETYHYQYGMSRKDLYQRMRNDMVAFTDKHWKKRKLELPLHSKKEALTLASIVEKETSKPSEYKKVASVYINRLRKGMKLQADPTVIYAVSGGMMDLKRSPSYDELKINSPYNTYVNKGLPPGPICNPGKGAIEAVMNPVDTDYIFFVADGKGGHIFTSNFKEHWELAEKWRKINRRNIIKKRRAERLLKNKTDGQIPQKRLSTGG